MAKEVILKAVARLSLSYIAEFEVITFSAKRSGKKDGDQVVLYKFATGGYPILSGSLPMVFDHRPWVLGPAKEALKAKTEEERKIAMSRLLKSANSKALVHVCNAENKDPYLNLYVAHRGMEVDHHLKQLYFRDDETHSWGEVQNQSLWDMWQKAEANEGFVGSNVTWFIVTNKDNLFSFKLAQRPDSDSDWDIMDVVFAEPYPEAQSS